MNTLELLDELQKKAMADEKMRWNWWMQGKIFMQK